MKSRLVDANGRQSLSAFELPKPVGLALWSLAALLVALTFVSWALVAVVHADDTYHVSHVSGAWLGLARYVDHGILYPPLFDGDAFGGTRFMPIQFVAYAGAAALFGGYVLGAKLVVYTTALLLFGAVFVVVRMLGCPPLLGLGVLAPLLATQTGLWAATAVSGDALPVLLQLAALALVARDRGRPGSRPVIGAGLLCALAVLSKLTALWAPAAILLWLVWQSRRLAILFLASLGTMFLLGGTFFALLSDGRLFENVIGLSGSSSLSLGAVLRDSPEKLFDLVQSSARPMVILAPLIFADVLVALVTRRVTPYHLGFFFAVPILLVVLADPGTDYNHLLDICVLGLVLVAHLWARTATHSGPLGLLPATIVLALVWSVAAGYRQELGPDAKTAGEIASGRDETTAFDLRPPHAEIRPTDRILSEDPYVPLSLDQRPVVLDAFMLLRMARAHPDWQAQLISRLDARAYDKVLLMRRLEPDRWWERNHFGLPIVTAIGRNYRLARPEPGWRGLWFYVPRP